VYTIIPVDSMLQGKISTNFHGFYSLVCYFSNNEIIPSSFDAELNTLPSVNKIYKTSLNIIDND